MTFCSPRDCSTLGSVHGILQARTLERVAMPSSRESSQPRDQTQVPCNAGDPSLIPGLGRFPGGGHGNPLQCACLENLQGQRSLAGYSPRGCKESDMTERLSTAQQQITNYFGSKWKVWYGTLFGESVKWIHNRISKLLPKRVLGVNNMVGRGSWS